MNRYDDRGSRPGGWARERDEWRRDPNGSREGRASQRSGEWQGSDRSSAWRGEESGSRDFRRGRDWERGDGSRSNRESWSQPAYRQREPYDVRDSSRRPRSSAPWDERGSRYSESQYAAGRDRYDRYDESRRVAEPERFDDPQLDEGPFADPSDSPEYFGVGYYGDGGTSYTGGFDQRSRSRYPGSLGEDTLRSSGRPRRYRAGPKGYVRSDERIREDISERLMMADSIDSSEVTVAVANGRVTLEGTVPTRSMKHAIEDLADYTAGVQDVENRIRVERPGAAGASTSSSGIQTASGITPSSGTGRTKQ